MGKFQDLTGKTFGRLTVLERAESRTTPSGYTLTQWRCKCLCGKEIITLGSSLRCGDTTSCGCYLDETRGKSSKKDILGLRFGRLVVAQELQPDKFQNVQWLCKCDCGKTTVATTTCLRNGHTKSCGCLKHDKTVERNKSHNGSHERLYKIWKGMKERCYYPKNSHYEHYGALGIVVCDEWRDNYAAFREWALCNGYNSRAEFGECTLDRIDVRGNYCPENCRWISLDTQANNKRNNHYLVYNNETHSMAEWASITGISYGTLKARLKRGWSVDKALSTPVIERNG